MNKLHHHLQKTVFVSIPGLVGDDQARPYKLIGVEPCGLWLEREVSVADQSASKDRQPGRGVGAALVPFAQIAYLLSDAPIDAVSDRRVAWPGLSEASLTTSPETKQQVAARGRREGKNKT